MTKVNKNGLVAISTCIHFTNDGIRRLVWLGISGWAKWIFKVAQFMNLNKARKRRKRRRYKCFWNWSVKTQVVSLTIIKTIADIIRLLFCFSFCRNIQGINVMELLTQIILLNNFLLSKNEQDTSHKRYMECGMVTLIW